MNGTRRSEANAVGFCQWLQRNWKRLNYFSPTPIEGRNQTTQAPYCAAYLSVLATKYGSFIPALSEHNAGGTNVGRTLITGAHLGAADVRERYFLGSKLARDLRALPGRDYEEVHRSYGPRSYLYAEMVFGNTLNVKRLIASMPQASINAMRPPRSISLNEIVERTGLAADEVRRFNPALVDRVPARRALYLPHYVSEFGPDVAFWRRPPSVAYVTVLDDFMRLESGPERWDDPAFAPVLREFKRRFRDSNTEEGVVMETVLAYAMDQAYTSSRRALLSDYRTSEKVQVVDRARGARARRAACRYRSNASGVMTPTALRCRSSMSGHLGDQPAGAWRTDDGSRSSSPISTSPTMRPPTGPRRSPPDRTSASRSTLIPERCFGGPPHLRRPDLIPSERLLPKQARDGFARWQPEALAALEIARRERP